MFKTLILIFFLIFTTGCTRTTAFDFFKMDEEHERAVTNMRTGTIVRSFETHAIISAVYLNAVDPEKYSGDEYFFIALYLQEDKRLCYKEGLGDPDYTLTLNGQHFLSGEELKKGDELRSLMPIQNEWNRYYLIRFASSATDELSLALENDRYGKVELAYLKARQ